MNIVDENDVYQSSIAKGLMMKPTNNIMATVSEGDVEKVKNMLKQAPFLVHAKDSAGRTPLSVAAWCGHTAVAALLLEHGADVNVRDRYGWTPLREADSSARKAVAKLLREYGAEE